MPGRHPNQVRGQAFVICAAQVLLSYLSLLTGDFVQAVLTGPIITDFVPAVKPPWALLAFAVFLLAMVLPREVLPEFCLASAAVAAGGWVVNRIYGRALPQGDGDEAPST